MFSFRHQVYFFWYILIVVFKIFFLDDKPKPPSEPAAPISKEIIPEEDTPWRRSGSLRNRGQPDNSPPKNRKY